MKIKTTFAAVLLAGAALLFSLYSEHSAFSSHGGPLNWIEGLHDEGVALSGTERPVLMGGDDGTNLVNLLVDSGGRLQVDVIAGAGASQTEDAVAASGETGAHLLAVHDPTPATATAASTDYQSLLSDGFGGLYVRLLGTSGAAFDPSLIQSTDSATGAYQSEDVAHATADVGIMVLGVENEDQAALTAGDKDYTPIAVSLQGNVLVELIGGTTAVTASNLDIQSGGGDLVLEATFAAATQAEDTALVDGDILTPVGVIRDDTPVASKTGVTNEWDVLSTDAFGGLYVRMLGTDGAAFDASSLLLTTDFTAVFGTSDLVKSEDAAHSTGDQGIASLAIRDDTPVSSLPASTGEYTMLQVDAFGGVYTRQLGTDGAAFDPTLAHSGSPILEVAVLQMIDGSGEGDITTDEFLASDAISISGSGRLVKICMIVSETIVAEKSEILFFDADPAINAEVTDLTFEEAQLVVAVISLATADYIVEADSAINCQAIDEAFHAITHVVVRHTGSTTLANTDIALHVWYKRES